MKNARQMFINCPSLKLKASLYQEILQNILRFSDAFQTVASDNNMYCRAFLYKLWQKSIKLFENGSLEPSQHGFHRQFSQIHPGSFLKSPLVIAALFPSYLGSSQPQVSDGLEILGYREIVTVLS